MPRRAGAGRADLPRWGQRGADGRARVVAGGMLPDPRRHRRQPRRQEALRRSTLQLQQAGAARRQHHRCATRLHQTQAEPAHRCRKSHHPSARAALALLRCGSH